MPGVSKRWWEGIQPLRSWYQGCSSTNTAGARGDPDCPCAHSAPLALQISHWHHRKKRESALGTSTTQEASQWGGLNQTGSRSGKTLWVTTLQRFRAARARQATGTPGGIPLPSEGGPGQAESSLAKEMVQGPRFNPGAGGKRLKPTGKRWSWGTSRQPRQKPWVGKSREGRDPQAPAGQALPVGLQGVRSLQGGRLFGP